MDVDTRSDQRRSLPEIQTSEKPMEAVKVGKRGTIVVPAKLRKRCGIEEGALVTTGARKDGKRHTY
jgi:AbrB family looped-hinge helix DNA binding protein